MSRSDSERISEALEHLDRLHAHLLRDDLHDETVADAVSLRLASAIETIQTSDGSLANRLFGDDWPLIWATRNRIAHGYAYVDMDLIAATVEQDLPGLETALRLELARLKDH